MANTFEASIDSLFEGVAPTLTGSIKPTIETRAITLWLPVDYCEKYERLQTKTKRRAGKLLKEVVKRSIDKLNVEI